jgi:hypothetical protein
MLLVVVVLSVTTHSVYAMQRSPAVPSQLDREGQMSIEQAYRVLGIGSGERVDKVALDQKYLSLLSADTEFQGDVEAAYKMIVQKVQPQGGLAIFGQRSVHEKLRLQEQMEEMRKRELIAQAMQTMSPQTRRLGVRKADKPRDWEFVEKPTEENVSVEEDGFILAEALSSGPRNEATPEQRSQAQRYAESTRSREQFKRNEELRRAELIQAQKEQRERPMEESTFMHLVR